MGSVTVSGPIFDGTADQALDDLAWDLAWDVGGQALADWSANLDASIRRPTPYYETQTTEQMITDASSAVHDRGIVYGPWLEGTADRNRSTRFKGYAAARRALQSTRARVAAIAARDLPPYLARMGGRP